MTLELNDFAVAFPAFFARLTSLRGLRPLPICALFKELKELVLEPSTDWKRAQAPQRRESRKERRESHSKSQFPSSGHFLRPLLSYTFAQFYEP